MKTKCWAIALTLLLAAACNVSDDSPQVNQSQNNTNNVATNNSTNNGTNNSTNNVATNNSTNNGTNNSTNNVATNNSTNNGTNMGTTALPPSTAVTGGSQVMQSANCKAKVSVGAPAANPKPKANEYQIEVGPVAPR